MKLKKKEMQYVLLILSEGGFSHVFRVLQQPPNGHGDAAGALPAQSL